jgi:hypothetical protein
MQNAVLHVGSIRFRALSPRADALDAVRRAAAEDDV